MLTPGGLSYSQENTSSAFINDAPVRLSLTSFLDECPNEVFGICLEDIVDFVEDCVDVFGQLFMAFSDVGLRLGLDLVDLVLVLLGPALAALMRGHRQLPLLSRIHPNPPLSAMLATVPV